jgi:hypothetical protein
VHAAVHLHGVAAAGLAGLQLGAGLPRQRVERGAQLGQWGAVSGSSSACSRIRFWSARPMP